MIFWLKFILRSVGSHGFASFMQRCLGEEVRCWGCLGWTCWPCPRFPFLVRSCLSCSVDKKPDKKVTYMERGFVNTCCADVLYRIFSLTA